MPVGGLGELDLAKGPSGPTRRATGTMASVTSPPTRLGGRRMLSPTSQPSRQISDEAWIDPRAGLMTLKDYANTWLKRRTDLRPRTAEL